MPAGRPTEYSEEIALLICEQVAQKIPVQKFAGEDGFPAERTIYQWLAKHEEFAQMYAHARARAGDRFAYAALDVADQVGKVTVGDDGQATVMAPDVARVKIDTLKWAAGKFAPRVYGDKIQQEITGKDGGAVQIQLTKYDEGL